MICDRCEAEGAERRRQKTAYHDDESNWAVLCSSCQEEADEYWSSLWDEYYSGLL